MLLWTSHSEALHSSKAPRPALFSSVTSPWGQEETRSFVWIRVPEAGAALGRRGRGVEPKCMVCVCTNPNREVFRHEGPGASRGEGWCLQGRAWNVEQDVTLGFVCLLRSEVRCQLILTGAVN